MESDALEHALQAAQRAQSEGLGLHRPTGLHILVLLAALYRREAQRLCLGTNQIPIAEPVGGGADSRGICPICFTRQHANAAGTVAAHKEKP